MRCILKIKWEIGVVADMFSVIFVSTSSINIFHVLSNGFVDIIAVVATQSAMVVLVITIYKFRTYSELKLYNMWVFLYSYPVLTASEFFLDGLVWFTDLII